MPDRSPGPPRGSVRPVDRSFLRAAGRPRSAPRAAVLVSAVATVAALLAVPTGELAAELAVDPELDPTAAETLWQWIAIRSPALTTCPPVAHPDWQESPLFPGATESLETFCRYRFTGASGPDLVPLAALLANGIVDLAPDRMVVHDLGNLGPVLSAPLAQRFDRHTGRIDLPIDPTAPPLRLSILDTSPTTGMNPNQLPESSPHGQTLQRFAEHLLCPSGPASAPACAAEITSRLALGYTSFERDRLTLRDVERGGFYGTVSDLARAIWDEASAARLDRVRLVLNLSVGWDPIYGGLETDSADMPPDVLAVYRALREAACAGALVIAASGNRTDRQDRQSGPLLPAAWAERKDPTGSFCTDLGGPHTPQLLYAVGGIQGTGAPLANARPGSSGSLVAYADHATLGQGHPSPDGAVAPPLTGSSVAALVASAASAAVLHYRPTWTAADVMWHLYVSGDPLGRPAEVCQAFSCGPVRAISLCQAVTQACHSQTGVAHCHAPMPPCPVRLLDPVDLGFAVGQLVTAATHSIDATPFTSTPHQPVCGTHQPLATPGVSPAEPCPHRQRRGLGRQPWTHPQPSSDPCPNCTLFPDSGGLALAIDPSFGGAATNPTLVTCPDGPTPVAYSLGPLQLGAGDQLWVQGLQPTSCDTAFVSFTVTEDGQTTSVLSPLLLAEP